MKGLFDKQKGSRFKTYIAHELGHYYFGNYKVFNSELGDIMLEGFAEFLSLEASKNVLADSIYQKIINDKIIALKDFKPIPFAMIKSNADYKDREYYVYYYAPLIFTAIKKEISEQKMWLWLQKILTTQADWTNYEFLVNTLSNTLQDKEQAELIQTKYFDSDNSLNNAIKKIEQK